MLARLVFLNGSKAGTTLQLEEKDVTIGRKPDRTVAYSPDEILVSTEHAKIVFQGGAYVLRDDGSRNGTFVNSQVIKERKLEHGDLIQFGPGGPTARFVVGKASGVAQTLDLAAQTEQRAAELLSAGGDQTLKTRDLLAVTYGRLAKQTRRGRFALIGIAVALGGVIVWQWQGRARMEAALSAMSAELMESRSTMEQSVAEVEARYRAMRDAVSTGDKQLARMPRVALAALTQYTRGVALIVYSYGFAEAKGGRLLRYVLDAQGQRQTTRGEDGRDIPTLSFAGSGPPVQRDGIATAVLIDTTGTTGVYLLTSRHAVEPWRDAPELASMRARGLDLTGRMIEIKGYLPPGSQSFIVHVDRISDQGDAAVVRAVGHLQAPPVPVAPDTVSLKTGDQLLSIGYPAELDNLLFRVDSIQRVEIRRVAAGDRQRLLDLIIERKLVVPVITDGTIGSVTATELTQTTSGMAAGSGAPLIDGHRRVVGLSAAARGVPIRFLWEILPASVQRRISGRGPAE